MARSAPPTNPAPRMPGLSLDNVPPPEVPRVQFMVIERYRNRDPVPVYRRFRERGRLAPEGLAYVNSWVTDDLATCYQIMECDDRSLLDAWMAQWQDLVDFEVLPVLSSAEAQARLAPNLD